MCRPPNLVLVLLLACVSLTMAITDESGSLGLQYFPVDVPNHKETQQTTDETGHPKCEDSVEPNKGIDGCDVDHNDKPLRESHASLGASQQTPEGLGNLDLLLLSSQLQEAEEAGMSGWMKGALEGFATTNEAPHGFSIDSVQQRTEQNNGLEAFLEEMQNRFAREAKDATDSTGRREMLENVGSLGMHIVNCGSGRLDGPPCDLFDNGIPGPVHSSLHDSLMQEFGAGNNDELTRERSRVPSSRRKREVEKAVARQVRDTKDRFSPQVLPGKMRKGFSSWGGKRVPPFGSWGGKRDPDFHSWGGKRDKTTLNTNQKQNNDPSAWEGKRVHAFYSWGGKRAPTFNSWGGKRAPFNSWGGKRAPFNSWGGKRAPSFNSWGGKRAPSFNSWGGKRAPSFNSWGGKRAPSFNSWGGKRAPSFNSWGGKRAPSSNSLGGKTAPFNSWGGKRAPFNSWGGKRASGGSSFESENMYDISSGEVITDDMLAKLLGLNTLEKLEDAISNHLVEADGPANGEQHLGGERHLDNPWVIPEPRVWASPNLNVNNEVEGDSQNKSAK